MHDGQMIFHHEESSLAGMDLFWDVDKTITKLTNELKEFRKVAGLTQQQLSESAGISRKSINAIENGVYIPSTVLSLKIAKTLNCSVEDLFQLP